MGICNVFYSVLSTYSNCSYNTNIVFFISQLFNRAYPTFLLLLVYFKLFSFPVFIHLFALASLLQLIIIIISLYKNNLLEFDFKISVTTKNLKKTMLVFGGSIFIVLIIDTLSSNLQVFTISDMKGIDITAIFVIASYISQVIQIPQRSISAIAIPVISTAWNENDIDKIRSIYKKSSVNMNIIGLALFLIISLNINTLFHVIGKNYESGINIALFMAIANLIDLSFGINNEIIGTSKFWKFNFITHVCLIAIQIPTNYFFIKHFGAIGAAYSLILSLTVYNTWRMVFLYVKYDMLPFSINSLYVIMYSLILFFLLNYIFGRFNILLFNSFQLNSLFLMAIRTFIVVILFVTPIYKYKVSEEFNGLLNSAFDKFKAITNK
jgi:O-antigen/teichoic acid export membrane protein